jgi:hypothetical protein
VNHNSSYLILKETGCSLRALVRDVLVKTVKLTFQNSTVSLFFTTSLMQISNTLSPLIYTRFAASKKQFLV